MGEAAEGLEVADLVEATKADVLVLDLLMPGLGGLDVAREVARRSPKTRIVVLSMHSSEAFVLRALRSGASAYVLKDSSTTELVRAVRAIQARGRYLMMSGQAEGIAKAAAHAECPNHSVREMLGATVS